MAPLPPAFLASLFALDLPHSSSSVWIRRCVYRPVITLSYNNSTRRCLEVSLEGCTRLGPIALAKKLLQFANVIEVVGRELRPNVLTDYLYDLAKAFSRFYDKKLGVRVIDATPEAVRVSRLRLCNVTARVLRLGLRLLGIDTIEQM
jgi:arginyl-tRNA synthetase